MTEGAHVSKSSKNIAEMVKDRDSGRTYPGAILHTSRTLTTDTYPGHFSHIILTLVSQTVPEGRLVLQS